MAKPRVLFLSLLSLIWGRYFVRVMKSFTVEAKSTMLSQDTSFKRLAPRAKTVSVSTSARDSETVRERCWFGFLYQRY